MAISSAAMVTQCLFWMTDNMHTTYLALGSNMGNRQQVMEQAIKMINEQIGAVVRQSSFYETEPWGFDSPNMFLNAAVCVETPLCPRCLLERTQQIERALGRTKKTTLHTPHSTLPTPHYSDRPIDIDILLYDDITVDEPDLKIPHPLMYERDFVMVPLREIKDGGPSI